MEERKKFKETKFGKWVVKAGKAAPDVIESVGMAVGGPWGTVVAKVGTALGNVLDKDPNNQEAKDLLAEFEQMKDLFRLEYEYDTIEVQEITKRWEADGNSDSRLAKNVRPIFLLFTLVSVVILAFTDSIDVVEFSVAEMWIELFQAMLMTAVVAYFGGRSWEKSRRGR